MTSVVTSKDPFVILKCDKHQGVILELSETFTYYLNEILKCHPGFLEHSALSSLEKLILPTLFISPVLHTAKSIYST